MSRWPIASAARRSSCRRRAWSTEARRRPRGFLSSGVGRRGIDRRMSEGSGSGSGVEISIATSVRRAQPSDTAALTDLVNRAYAIEAFFVDGMRTTADEIAGLIRSGGFLVLEYAGGICAAVLFQGPGEHHGLPPSHAYFGLLSVLPEMQGMGLGGRLVRVAEAMAEASGATAMRLRVINLREELSRWYKSL